MRVHCVDLDYIMYSCFQRSKDASDAVRGHSRAASHHDPPKWLSRPDPRNKYVNIIKPCSTRTNLK